MTTDLDLPVPQDRHAPHPDRRFIIRLRAPAISRPLIEPDGLPRLREADLHSDQELEDRILQSTHCKDHLEEAENKRPQAVLLANDKGQVDKHVSKITSAGMAAPPPPLESLADESSVFLRRFCPKCNKEFSSGHALGGHMRVHGALYAEAAVERELKRRQLLSSKRRAPAAAMGPYTNAGKVHEAPRLFKKPRCSSNGSSFLQTNGCEEELVDEESDREAAEDMSLKSDVVEDELLMPEKDAKQPNSSLEERRFPEAHGYGVQVKENNHHQALLEGSKGPDMAIAPTSPTAQEEKMKTLYELRRNPKRSQRFTEEELAFADAQGLTRPSLSLAFLGNAGSGWCCSTCGKAFWSQKALFGHMRCHADQRVVRKKPSPLNSSHSEGSTVEDKELEDAGEAVAAAKLPENCDATVFTTDAQYLKRRNEGKLAQQGGGKDVWAFGARPTGKRSERSWIIRPRTPSATHELTSTDEGRPVLTSGDESDEGADDPEMILACLTLVAMSAGKRLLDDPEQQLGFAGTPPYVRPELDAVKPVPEADYPTTVHYSWDEDKGASVKPEILVTDDLNSLRLALPLPKSIAVKPLQPEADRTAVCHSESEDKDKGKIVRREPHIRDIDHSHQLASNGSGVVKFECSTCKKCFGSHQALGGHRASHKKIKGCSARASPSADQEEVDQDEQQHYFTTEDQPTHQLDHNPWNRQETPSSENQKLGQKHKFDVEGHVCSICYRVFPTGQALGGHKRCHWTGEKNVDRSGATSSCDKQPSFLSGGQTRKVQGFDIDLNLPAPMDVDEEFGDGCAELAGPSLELHEEPLLECEQPSNNSTAPLLLTCNEEFTNEDLPEEQAMRTQKFPNESADERAISIEDLPGE